MENTTHKVPDSSNDPTEDAKSATEEEPGPSHDVKLPQNDVEKEPPETTGDNRVNDDPSETPARDPRSCVKVFVLDAEGKWCDEGTGHVESVFVAPKEAWCIVVRADSDNSLLMNSTIRTEINYLRQQDTLIVWTEPSGKDLALSFQEPAGCDDLWDELDMIKKRLAADNGDIDQLPHSRQESAEEFSTGSKDFDLPDPTFANLKELEESLMRVCRSAFGREVLTAALERTGFIEKLFQIFDQAEDIEDTESLYAIANVMRAIICLNEGHVFEYLLSDEVYMKTLGTLEYDRDLPNYKANHREHFEKFAQFKQIVPITRSEVRAKINQTYRLQYLKDVALARVLEDVTISVLTSMLFFNQVEILGFVRQDADFLSALFSLMSDKDTPREKLKEAIAFLHEICSVTKSLQSLNRAMFYRHCDPDAFFRTLLSHGLIDILTQYMGSEDLSMRTSITAITSQVLEHDANLVRSLSQAEVKAEKRPFVQLLIDRLLEEEDAGLRAQYTEMIRTLLDTSPLDTSEGIVAHIPSSENAVDNFLQLFYDECVEKLLRPLLDLDATDRLRSMPDGSEVFVMDPDRAAVCNHICDLLCFMIKQHSFRSKYMFMKHDLVPQISLLLKAKESYLRLTALRVFRVCVGMKDDFYTTQCLLKKDAFKAIIHAFVETKSRYNLLNSACLELLEFIRRENMKPLVAHVVTNYKKELEQVKYVDTWNQLVLRYEQNSDPPPYSPTAAETAKEPPGKRDGWAKAMDDDEAYFNASDDEEEAATSSQESTEDVVLSPRKRRHAIEFVRASSDTLQPRALVPYEDDDDDKLEELASKSRSPSPKPIKFSVSPLKFSAAIGGKEKRRREEERAETDDHPAKRDRKVDEVSLKDSPRQNGTQLSDSEPSTGVDELRSKPPGRRPLAEAFITHGYQEETGKSTRTVESENSGGSLTTPEIATGSENNGG
ncbi:Platinum sensitivity protein [Gaertneriomyces sp. JEL0708]|nr:Platinum sensitivity protein [Gaertneriomyces sp. JEL0708]